MQLPRTAGRKDSEYMHLFSGPIDIELYESEVQETKASESSGRVTVSDLVQRVSVLEQEVAELKKVLQSPD
ncbi:MAG: hypothetical protein HN349_08435 [Gammaproteobacteria bacterium]|nr:hypothetical protein [Gammaproteobacteria bacterium]